MEVVEVKAELVSLVRWLKRSANCFEKLKIRSAMVVILDRHKGLVSFATLFYNPRREWSRLCLSIYIITPT